MNMIGHFISTAIIISCYSTAHAVSIFGVKTTGGDLDPVSSFEDDEFITATGFSSMPAVPLPAGVWLFGTALLNLFGPGRRRKS